MAQHLALIELDTCIHDSSEGGALSIETISLEAKLGHVPDLQPFEPHINSARRDLFHENEYFLYRCISETEMKLKRNQNFRHVERACVYGDAFVFKRKKGGSSEDLAMYENMKEDSARSFNDRNDDYIRVKRMLTRQSEDRWGWRGSDINKDRNELDPCGELFVSYQTFSSPN